VGIVITLSDPRMAMSNFHSGDASREPAREFRAVVGLHHHKIKFSTSSGISQKQDTISSTNLLGHFGIRPSGVQVNYRIHVKSSAGASQEMNGI
jgi:hypothetical protein